LSTGANEITFSTTDVTESLARLTSDGHPLLLWRKTSAVVSIVAEGRKGSGKEDYAGEARQEAQVKGHW
jgi:hypothetical protein